MQFTYACNTLQSVHNINKHPIVFEFFSVLKLKKIGGGTKFFKIVFINEKFVVLLLQITSTLGTDIQKLTERHIY